MFNLWDDMLYVNGFYTVDVKNNSVNKHISDGNSIIATKVNNTADGVMYYHSNHIGSTALLTDKNSDKHASCLYLPYGETWVTDSNPNSAITRLFTGHEYDSETGLYYANARYYDPELAVFTTSDPAMSGMNHYGYCDGNPVMYSDPTGLERGGRASKSHASISGNNNYCKTSNGNTRGGTASKSHKSLSGNTSTYLNRTDRAARHQAATQFMWDNGLFSAEEMSLMSGIAGLGDDSSGGNYGAPGEIGTGGGGGDSTQETLADKINSVAKSTDIDVIMSEGDITITIENLSNNEIEKLSEIKAKFKPGLALKASIKGNILGALLDSVTNAKFGDDGKLNFDGFVGDFVANLIKGAGATLTGILVNGVLVGEVGAAAGPYGFIAGFVAAIVFESVDTMTGNQLSGAINFAYQSITGQIIREGSKAYGELEYGIQDFYNQQYGPFRDPTLIFGQ